MSLLTSLVLKYGGAAIGAILPKVVPLIESTIHKGILTAEALIGKGQGALKKNAVLSSAAPYVDAIIQKLAEDLQPSIAAAAAGTASAASSPAEAAPTAADLEQQLSGMMSGLVESTIATAKKQPGGLTPATATAALAGGASVSATSPGPGAVAPIQLQPGQRLLIEWSGSGPDVKVTTA